MIVEVPENGPEFDALMRAIDPDFVKTGVKITARAWMAAREISRRYDISIPIIDPGPGSPAERFRYARERDYYIRSFDEGPSEPASTSMRLNANGSSSG